MMKLVTAKLYYGIRSIDMNFLFDEDKFFREVEFAPVTGKALDRLCEVVARHTGCLSAQNVRDRINHNVAIPEQRFEGVRQDGSDLVIPASVQVIGNGFSIIWK